MNILIVDDHLLFTEGLKYILNTEIKIKNLETAENGKAAINKSIKNQFDLVLMDINLPLMNGIFACKEIKRHSPETKVIFLTMFCDLTHAIQAFNAGADGFVFKGNSFEELTCAIRETQRGHKYVTETLRHFFENTNKPLVDAREHEENSFRPIITKREREILTLISEGHTNDKIADLLNIAVRTVDTHRTNMLHKLKLSNTAALIKFAIKNGLID